MIKTHLKRFLRDRLPFVLCYLFGTGSIILFYWLEGPDEAELLYPVLMALTVLCMFLAVDAIRYVKAGQGLVKVMDNPSVIFEPHTEEQKLYLELLNRMRTDHSSQISRLKAEEKERQYFFSNWIHHLKTPVAVMEMIVDSEQPAEAIEKVRFETKRIHSSLEQGLAMVRMDSFANDLEPRTSDLLDSLRKLINARKRECIYQSVFPSIECPGGSALVITDPKWNDLLLDQIISNAIKYSGVQEGNKKVIFRIEKKEDDTLLTIMDEGPGIPPYDLEKVFEPFFTGENGRKYAGSSGIGLYIAQRVAVKLGHSLGIASSPRKGTEVTIQYKTGLADSEKLTIL